MAESTAPASNDPEAPSALDSDSRSVPTEIESFEYTVPVCFGLALPLLATALAYPMSEVLALLRLPNPVRTSLHAPLLTSVPIATFLALPSGLPCRRGPHRITSFALGFACGVSGVFGAAFLPGVGYGLLGLIALGLGLFLLTPYLAIFALERLLDHHSRIGRAAGIRVWTHFLFAMVLGAAAVFWIELPDLRRIHRVAGAARVDPIATAPVVAELRDGDYYGDPFRLWDTGGWDRLGPAARLYAQFALRSSVTGISPIETAGRSR